MFSKTAWTLLALTTMMAIANVVSAAPSGLRPRMHRRNDSSSGGSSGSSGSSDYKSMYYEWVPVEYDKCKNWDSYKDYHLVKADSYDKDKVEIFVCLVKFSEDNSYRIGWFDPSVAFLCTVVYQGDVVEAKDDKYESYYLTTLGDYQAYWASWDELLNYTEDHIVYAPDHDCVPGEVCWKVNSGGGFITYTDPDGTKTDTWGSQSGSDSGSGSKSRRSWTKALGKRDYEKPTKPQEYAPPDEFCYIGYGSSVTDYKVFYGYEDKAYQSDDIRYNKDVKALVILIDEGSSSSSSGNHSGGSSSSGGDSGSGSSGSGGGSSGGSNQ